MPNDPSSFRLRTGRFSEAGRVYLISFNTKNRRQVFNDWHKGRLVVEELRRAHEQGLTQSIAWVIMPDHVHWLLELDRASLSQLMKQVKARSAIAINRASPGYGFAWQPGYHDKAIRNNSEILSFARYIIANPLRAGLVDCIGDYPLWDATWL